MRKSILYLSEDTALRFGKTLSWLLIYHVARGWELVETSHHPAVGKTYKLTHLHPISGPTYSA